MQLHELVEYLKAFAPTDLAEDWDNVGLLVGDAHADVTRVMTCLTITPSSADEAIRERAEMIVTHHPLPFRALQRLTTETVTGRLLWKLIRAGVAIYSPHTAFDSAARGINQSLAEGLGLEFIRPLVPIVQNGSPTELGSGRVGELSAPETLTDVAVRVKRFLRIDGLHQVGPSEQVVRRVAVACGSAGQFLAAAREQKCHVLVTGETNFHTCLEAEATGMGLLLPGHFASERFAVEQLAEVLARQFAELTVWASRHERDPLLWA